MLLSKHILLHWQKYTILERLLVLFPLTLVTPTFIPFITSLTHDGETTHELVITIYLLVTLTVGIFFQPKFLIKLPKFGSIEFFACLFVLWTTCSLLWTSSTGATLAQIVIWADYAALMLISAACLRRRSKIGVASMLMVAAVFLAVIKLLGYAMVEGDQPGNSPLFKNIGVEPEILVTLMPIFWIVFLSSRRKLILIVSLLSSIICILATIASYQRTPLLALIGITVIITTYTLARWFRPKFNRRALILVLAIIFSYIIQTNLPSKLYGRTGIEVLAEKIVDESSLKASASGRFVLWDCALEMLIRHPLLGVGAGAYKAEYSTYRSLINQHSHLPAKYQATLFTPDQTDGTASNFRAHNEFFQVFGELGLIGGLLLLAMIARLVQHLFNCRNKVASCVVMSGAIAFLICSNFSSFSFRWIPCGLAFFLLISLVSSTASEAETTELKYHKWVPCFAIASLLLCSVRSSQVFLSQYFEAQADLGASGNNKDNYQLALNIDPYNFTAQFKLGWMCYLTMEPQRAVPLLEGALKLGINDITSFQTLALAQVRIGEKAKAEATLQEGLKMCPSSVFLRVTYAELLKRRGEAQSSKQLMDEARKINPECTNAAEILWTAEKINANKYIEVANKMGPIWGVMTVNRGADLEYK